MGELRAGLAEYFTFYNGERPHQSLDYKTPDVVYRTATGGGALIVDKFPHGVLVDENHVPIFSTEKEGSIEDGVEVKIKLQQGQCRRRSVMNEVKYAA